MFVQVSSPGACFISKIQQFELPSFHSAWHQNKNAVSPFLIFSSLTISGIKRCVYVHECYRKSELQMFLLITGGHIGGPKLSTNMASPYNADYKGA